MNSPRLEPAAARPILIVENATLGRASLIHAARESAFLNPLVALPDTQTVNRYLNGEGIYANREEFPLPILVLVDVTLPQAPSPAVLPWLTEPPPSRQVVITVLSGAIDPGLFDSATAFGPNSILCKLAFPDSAKAMFRVLLWLIAEVNSPAAVARTAASMSPLHL